MVCGKAPCALPVLLSAWGQVWEGLALDTKAHQLEHAISCHWTVEWISIAQVAVVHKLTILHRHSSSQEEQ